MRKFLFIVLSAVLATAFMPTGLSAHEVTDLRCEEAANPLAIETYTPRLSWKNAGQAHFFQSAYQIQMASSETAVSSGKGLLWDSGKVLSDRSVLVGVDGHILKDGQTYYWRVRTWDEKGRKSRWSETAFFGVALMSEADWGGAKWIAFQRDKASEVYTKAMHQSSGAQKVLGDKKIGFYQLPQFRKEFYCGKVIRRAYAYVCGLGQFDMFLNGCKVGDHFLDPGWTKYDKSALYVTFDITSSVRMGDNAVGVMLGNGMFNIPRERYFKILQSYGAPRLLMKIQIDYEDGTSQTIVTGPDWKVTKSPITFSSIYGGEDYDSRLYHKGWESPLYDDSNWFPPVVLDWKTELHSQMADPLKIHDILPAVRHFKDKAGNWIYDLGQNFSGTVRIRVNAISASPVKMEMAELTDGDSTLFLKTNWVPYYCVFTPSGKGEETWQPQFTYYGFRYVEVSGAVPEGEPNPGGLPVVEKLEGFHTSNAAPEVGTFHCSNDLFNRTYTLVDWAIRSNMASILTDCPHREKLGWLEQDHMVQYSMQYRYDLVRLYSKIMRDISEAQHQDNGMVPTIAPEYVTFAGGFADTPEWGSTFIISPWYIYLWYGDDSLIRTYYPMMKRYVEYLSSRAEDNIVSYGLGDWYDIGPNPKPGVSQMTSNGVSATAIYYYDVCLMARMAALQGCSEDAAAYRKLASAIKDSFNRRFWNPDTRRYDRNSQAANAMALYMGLVPEENRKTVLDNLIADIRARGNSLTAGDVGYRYVLGALQQAGRSDVIYDMNSRSDVYGYGWQLSHGATALTETWQALPDKSNNHLMLGHIMEWFFSGLGGLQLDSSQSPDGIPESVGFKHFIVAPQPVGDVTSCDVTYQSPYGQIKVSWKIVSGKFALDVTVPDNSSATLVMPTLSAATTPAASPVIHEVDSGSWHFE